MLFLLLLLIHHRYFQGLSVWTLGVYVDDVGHFWSLASTSLSFSELSFELWQDNDLINDKKRVPVEVSLTILLVS